MKSKFVCPYCFETVKSKDVQFRCTNVRCAEHDDVEMTRYERGNIAMPKKGRRTFTRRGGAAQSARCPDCGTETYMRICPYCHNELPESTLSGEDFIISVVGARGAGKSHYVGVIVHELIRRISVAFGGCIEDFSDSRHRWEVGFMRSLYMERKKLPMTRSSLYDVDNGAYRPLIFQFRILGKKGAANGKSITLVFFDTAGEDLRNERIMDEVNRYICKSSGIIFLLDPTQIPYVAEHMDREALRMAQGAGMANEADEITSRTAHMIRSHNGIADGKKIKTPVAVVFSKLDCIEPLLPQGLTMTSESPHCASGAFMMQDAKNVNEETKALLLRWGAESFIQRVDNDYSDYSFFTMSALGMRNNPREGGAIDIPRPHRIEDALLWLLSQTGIIRKQ